MRFKETTVGKIPKEWNVEKVDNLKADIKNAIAMGPFGSNIKKENFVDRGVPVLRGVNLGDTKLTEDEFIYLTEEKAEKLKASRVVRGDIVITHRGTLGQVSYVPMNSKFEAYIVSQSGMKLTCDKNKINYKFLAYFFNSRIGQYILLMNKSQVGVPSIATPTTSLKQMEVPLPPLVEQKAIAKILSDLDEKIEINNKINKNLEEMTQTIFKQWFVDFEFPNEEGKPYKSSGGEMVKSELGMIPLIFRVQKLNEILEIKYGKNLPTKKLLNSGYKVYGGNGVIGYYSEYIYEEPQILIACRGAASGKVNISSEKVFVTNNSLVLNLENRKMYEYFKSYFLLKEFKAYATGSAQPQITINNLSNIDILCSPDNIAIKYGNVIKIFDKKKKNICEENERLENLRDTLLQKLMSGEIRISLK